MAHRVNRVGAKGQVVIEKAIRDELGIQPGDLAFQLVVDGHVEIHFLREHNRSLAGSLAKYVKRSISQEEWEERHDEIAGQAVAEQWRERQAMIAEEEAAYERERE